MLGSEDSTVQLDLARQVRQTVAVAAAAALVGACADRGQRPSDRADSSGAAAAVLAHVNGAVHHSPAPRAGSAARVAASNGSSPVAARVAEAPGGDGPSAEDTAEVNGILSDRRGAAGGPAGSAAVASTPDELSALAASLVVPVAGVTPAELHSSFNDARGGGTRRHNALDIPAPRGTPVISATAGRVLRLYNSKSGGIMVYAADATERFILMYGHLDRYATGLREGMPLARGQTIGYVGTTGNAPANVPHLHFAIARTSDVTRWWTGTAVDPAPLLKR